MKCPTLEIVSPAGKQQVPLSNEQLTIGRQLGNMLVIDDVQASRFHCVVEKAAGGFRVRDLGSRNGTKMNGKLINTARFDEGDVMTIGLTTLTMVGDPNASAPTPARAAPRNAPPITTAVPKVIRPMDDMMEEVIDDPIEEIMEEIPDEPAQVDVFSKEQQRLAEMRRADAPPIESLSQMAEALPEKTFNHYDIALLNARGGIAHPSGAAARDSGEASEAVTLLRLLLLVCFRTRASDVHIEPKNDLYLVRVRIDGSMVDAAKLKKETGVKLCAVIKILCDIDISQRNSVQEGHFGTRVPDRRVDYRVSFTPSMFGQKCVIRVLDTANAPRYLWDLNLPEWMFQAVDKTIRGEGGMVLVCGPTGSGKTASLYSALRSIDCGERNVVTIEDPVEIQIEGITQIPVNEVQGNTFPVLLRSVLRQDPDVILVGEIRDGETARTAMQAAMTGHLVLSTIHARDTVGSIFRLQDLGMEPYLIASGLHVMVSQRLVRQLCKFCKVGMRPTPEQAALLEPIAGKVGRIFRASGCPRCLGTGFFGRRAVFETLIINEQIRELIQKAPNATEITSALKETKFTRLLASGYKLVAEGVTTIDEIERAVT